MKPEPETEWSKTGCINLLMYDCLVAGVVEGTTQSPGGGCSEGEFTCFDGACVDMTRRCDGYPDCQDHSDELECYGMYSLLYSLHSSGLFPRFCHFGGSIWDLAICRVTLGLLVSRLFGY